ncbi:NAD(P)/FAD-dependent oxidoreductase [Streptomyces griseorubiginosus]|uniref:NAD(P)/FAD-dependent oxidoreductase n=1 Tax=Streptomyces griseorubiginosus TaxID=67304 RepID=UPI00076CCF20|nr:FAD-dependent oxidoreductase [Streptomyces griseorubiginosus]KUM76857.1 FAD-dependent oxidoreductase [Streptomyces griseorubiginosus]
MTSADVTVVGGGIIGCLVAAEVLARAPGTRVVVLERDAMGSGASRRSAGLHFPRGGTERVRSMSAFSQSFYEKLRSQDPRLPIRPLSMHVLSSDTSHLEQTYLAAAGLTRSTGLPGDMVAAPAGTQVWKGRGCQYADVGALTEALARAVRPHIGIREGTAVTGIEVGSSEVTLRLSTGEAMASSKVVLAPGPWVGDPAWRSLVEPLGVRVKKVVALHIEQAPQEDDGAIIFEDDDAFLLPVHHRGHWLFSYTCRDWHVEPDRLTGGMSRANLDEALSCLGAYAPALVAHATSGRVFCDAYSPTHEPLVRTLGAGHVVFAGAANGSGYRLAPAIADEAAGLLGMTSSGRRNAS